MAMILAGKMAAALLGIGAIISAEKAVQVPVAIFQEDGLFSNETYMRYLNNFSDELTNMTLCFRLKLFHLRGSHNVLLNYAAQEDMDMIKSAFVDRFDSLMLETCRSKYTNVECNSLNMTDEILFRQWIHFCTTFEVHMLESQPSPSDESTIIRTVTSAYKDGTLVNTRDHFTRRTKFLTAKPGGVFILGQDQDQIGGGFEANQAFSGEITQVGLWHRILSHDEINGLANCSSSYQGTQVAWDMQHWDANEVKIEHRNLSTFCSLDPLLNMFVWPQKISHNILHKICFDHMSALVPTLSTREDLPVMSAEVEATFAALPRHETSSCYRSGKVAYTLGERLPDRLENWSEVLVWDNFTIPEELHGKRCLYAAGDQLVPQDCHIGKACGICRLHAGKTLKLKGLCFQEDLKAEKREYFDTEYYVYGQLNGRPHFRGIRNSHIYYYNEQWTIESYRDNNKFSYIENNVIVPLGTQLWSPDVFCNLGYLNYEGKKELTLSGCDSNFFTCNDGNCVYIDFKCDSEFDCPDKSDEQNCTYLVLGADYQKELMPRTVEMRDEPVVVYINVSILTLRSIDTAQMQFTADFFLSLRWHDLRVVLQDLSSIALLNTLSEGIVSNLWKPQLTFLNALGPYQTVYDEKVSAMVIKENEPLPEDMSRSKEANVFDSANNSILMIREYFLEYRCNFDLTYFPFDTQMCKMVFQVEGKTDSFVKLVKDGEGVEFLDERYLVEYEILKEVLEIKTVNSVSVAEVKIVIRRRVEYHLYNTVSQTLILIFVGYLSYYFDLDDFTDRIMVTLTTMLVIATTTSAIQKDLPKTSNFKMVDWWLFFASNVLVITMAFHTYLAYLCQTANRTDGGGGGGGGGNQSNRKHHFFIPRLLRFGRMRAKGAKKMGSTVYPEGEANEAEQLPSTPPLPAEEEDDGERKVDERMLAARRFNSFAKLVYLAVVVVFNVVFWILAIHQYHRPAEDFLAKEPNQTTNHSKFEAHGYYDYPHVLGWHADYHYDNEK